MLNSVIDLSHHNRIYNVNAVRDSGILGVIHKATQGQSFKDPTFAMNRKRLRDAGLLFGAYHFGTSGDGTAQADHLLSVAKDDSLLVLDFESNPQGYDMSLLEAEQFVHHIYVSTGRYPGIYSGHTIKEAFASAGISRPDQTLLSKCWLWIAQYGQTPLIPSVWDRWTLWQYTDGAVGPKPHQVEGIGRCDRNQFNGTEAELRALWQL
jgi:lysozyme